MSDNDKLHAFNECYKKHGSEEQKVTTCMKQWQEIYDVFGGKEMEEHYRKYLKEANRRKKLSG